MLVANGEGGIRFDGRGINVLALFKYVIGNFSATTAEGSMADCRRFLLDRENLDFPGKYRLFMFAVPEQGAGMLATGWATLLLSSGGLPTTRLPSLRRFPWDSSFSTRSDPAASQTDLAAR